MLRNADGCNFKQRYNHRKMKSSLLRLLILFTATWQVCDAQVLYTKSGEISFSSYTPLEEIYAINAKAVSVLNANEHSLDFSVLVKGFRFKNAMMQTHFNENYMESSTYPKAVFKSKNIAFDKLNFDVDGVYEVPVKGVLTVKDVDKEIETIAIFTIEDHHVHAEASFTVSAADFHIDIPKLVRNKIAREIEVNVRTDYQPYNKS